MMNLVPLQDEREHEHSADCPCEPRVEWQDPETGEIYSQALVIHNAFDHREIVEELIPGESAAPGKNWGLFDSE